MPATTLRIAQQPDGADPATPFRSPAVVQLVDGEARTDWVEPDFLVTAQVIAGPPPLGVPNASMGLRLTGAFAVFMTAAVRATVRLQGGSRAVLALSCPVHLRSLTLRAGSRARLTLSD